MAFPEIKIECLDNKHETCPRNIPIVQKPGQPVVIGGSFCICECHWDGKELNQAWIDEVRASSIAARERRT